MLSTPTRSLNIRQAYRPDSKSTNLAVEINVPGSWQPIVPVPESPHTHVVPFRESPSPRQTDITGVEYPEPRSPLQKYTNLFPSTFTKQPSTYEWEVPLCYKIPDGPIEKILHGVIEIQREFTNAGPTETTPAGPLNPSISALLAPERFRSFQIHPLARILGEMLSKITYRTLIDKLGAFVIMYPIYQWQIMTSYESYVNVPSWCRPVLSQRTTPHPVWLCALGPPLLREAVIADQQRYCTEEFQYLFIASLNMNWPHGLREAVVWDGKDFKFSKAFWNHARVMENWSLDEAFQSRYPELKACVKFTERPEMKASRI